MTSHRWIDLSVTLKTGLVHWPGDPAVRIDRIQDREGTVTVNLSKITMGAHSGTHIDAPGHFLQGARGTDDIPFSSLIGTARVIGIASPGAVTRSELESHRIRRGERVLLKTLNSERRLLHREDFTADFVHLGADAADYIVGRGVRTIGIDYLSIGGYKKDGCPVHLQLLRAGILIIEGLDLSGVPAGRYEMICLPIRIRNGDGAPARVLLKRTGGMRTRSWPSSGEQP